MFRRVNTFEKLLKEETLSCLMTQRRRGQIRTQLYRYVRDACSYRSVIEILVKDMLAVYRDMGGQTTSGVGLGKRPGLSRGCDCESTRDLLQARTEILALAAHFCEKYRLDNSDLVESIIREYYIHNQSLNDWFDFLNPFGNVDRLLNSSLYPYKSESYGPIGRWITSKHLTALDYFLTAAKHMTLTEPLPTRDPQEEPEVLANLPMVDFPIQNVLFGWLTPLTLACLSGHPEAVQLLLRHGASIRNPYRRPSWPFLDWSQPLYVLIIQLNERKDDDFAGVDLDLEMAEHFEETRLRGMEEEDSLRVLGSWRAKNLLRCMRIVCRAAPRLPVKFSSRVNTGDDHHRDQSVVLIHTHFKDLLPRWLQLTEPPSLQHLCRCEIRNILLDNWNLPLGITTLPIPNILKYYLDLKRG